MNLRIIAIPALFLFFGSCTNRHVVNQPVIETGAEQIRDYTEILKNKNVAVVANHTSLVDNTHLVDTLISLGVQVERIFSPEHGFRGVHDAGELVDNHIDQKTGLPVISLYGNHRKPLPENLEGIDIVVFDIQDVGVRFYTYISTMHYVMEACAENNVGLMILDRPNPNGFYVDGPVLDSNYKSFIGMHPVPVVHGMTIAEFAKMINGEQWLEGDLTCNLITIPCKNYTHDSLYSLPVNPSPNLQTMRAIYLYPSLAFFEGTVVSVGRGTDFPFEVYGHPALDSTGFSFKPRSIRGASLNPKHKDKMCYGVDLREIKIDSLISRKEIQLQWLIDVYNEMNLGDEFFLPYFYNLSGSHFLKKQLINGFSEDEIKRSWQKDLDHFKELRSKYLLYPDFSNSL